MARPQVVNTLEAKYARLLGCQNRLRRPSRSIAADLAHIEAVIRLFDPAWDKAAVKPIAPRFPSRWQSKGEGVRAAIEAVRQADRPLSATEIAQAAYRICGREPPPAIELRLVGTDLIYSLRRHFGSELVASGGRPIRWQVMPPAANSLPISG